MTLEERLEKLEMKVWCQDLIIYQLTSVLQEMKKAAGVELYEEIQHAFVSRLVSMLLATGHETVDIAPAQAWLFHLNPDDDLDMTEVLFASAPPSGALLN